MVKKRKNRWNKKRVDHWYDEELTVEDAEQFFEELRAARDIYLKSYADIDPEEIVSVTNNRKFVPRGIVLHTSGLRTLKESVMLNNTGYFSSHFIIPSNQYERGLPKSKFPLLRDIPGSIIMLHDFTKLVPHSGYLSTVTWGIELRNYSYLKANEEKFVRPLYPEEYDDYNLRLWMKKPLYYTSREENWTREYERPAITWQGYHYERFSRRQYLTLCVLIKCLTILFKDKLNPALMLPSSAVIDKPHNCPSLPIDLFQKKISIINTNDKRFKLNSLYNVTDRSQIYPNDEIEGEDDSRITDSRAIEQRIKECAWRTTDDRNKLIKIFRHGDVKFLNVFRKYKKAIEAMGYFSREPYFTKSLQLYANAREIELDENALEYELEKDFYSLVNGVYND